MSKRGREGGGMKREGVYQGRGKRVEEGEKEGGMLGFCLRQQA